MKKFLLFSLLALSVLTSTSQNPIDFSKAAALKLVYDNKEAIGLSEKELTDYTVSSTYGVASTGMTMVYLQQTYKGVPVLNYLKVLAFMDGKVVSNAGNPLQNLDQLTLASSSSPAITPEQAAARAFEEEKIAVPVLNLKSKSADGKKFDYGTPLGVTANLTVELMWIPIYKDNKTTVELGWQVVMVPYNSDDIWLTRINALDGHLIEKQNLVVYETLEAPKNRKRTSSINPDAYKNFTNNFGTSVSDGVESPSIVANATYNVIPYPFESPNVAPPAIRNNPWTAAPGNATTLGWHSNGTTDYTITRGNNVWAREDTAGIVTLPDESTTGLPATSTTGNPNLNFNFTPVLCQEPSFNTPTQMFAITNLFYWVNVTHDITYQYGFDEVAGNFQTNNQSRGGSGNDAVFAYAQSAHNFTSAGVPIHTHIGNNANFGTLPDGGLARMRMYLWSAFTNLHVNTPGTIAGDFQTVESGFSINNKLACTGPVTGQVVYYDDGGGTHEACGPPSNSLTGKIALIDRGTCNFTVKVLNAQSAGAIAAIVVNNVPSQLVTMAGDDNTITIPAVFITQEDGDIFKAQLANNLNVTLTGTAVKDGDMDASIMVHEYTHGISNRFTGGPATTSCLNNDEEGGEGWSDYVALMLTTNWATATTSDGPNARPIGTFVLHQAPNGEGIRNYPYSTNIAISPLTYAHMGLTGGVWGPGGNGNGVHNIGEIWCAALWDMTWGIIQQENNINTNLYNFSLANNGGNSIALKLVMEGMRLQPCSPGYIDARNAILTADMTLYGGRHQCAIWTAFAKRGMGYSALQGSSDNTTDQTAAFNLPPAPTITTQPASITVNPGDNAVFTVAATAPINGASLLYTWQVSTDGGTTWNDIVPAVTTPTLTLTAVTIPMNGNKYRCIIKQGCASTTSSVATLTINVPGGFTFTTPAPATAACPAPNTMDIVLGTTPFGGFTNAITVSSSPIPPAGTSITFIPSSTVTPGNTVTVRFTGTASLSPASYTFTITGTAIGATTQTRDITYTITAGTPPAITAQPGNQAICAGGNASFSITSAAATSFQWQLSTDGGSNWSNVTNGGVYSNATTATLNITGATVSLNNNQYRAIASTVCGSTTSAAGILTVNTPPAITGQPANASVCAGSNHTFTVTTTGSSLTFQWQFSTDGGANWNNVPAAAPYSGTTTASLLITGVPAGLNTNQYRVIVTGVCPVSPLTSNPATLTVGTPVSITAQPVDVTVCAGNNTSFSVTATGAISYQWQLSTDGGGNWSNVPAAAPYSGTTTATLNITGATAALNGNRYRCVITSGCGSINSASALLTVNTQPAITTQPANASVCTGTNHTFTAVVTGTSLTYQWQFSIDNGANWNNVPAAAPYSGTTTASLLITGVTAGLNNNQYRLVITGVCPVTPLTSNPVTLTVATTLSITGQPAPVTICAGANASFTVTAAGAGAYQWQLSTDGGSNWSNVPAAAPYSGTTTATLNITGATAALNGNQYRSQLTSSCGNATSAAVLLTVNTAPAITAHPTNATVCAGANNTFTVTATGTNLTYQWEISTNGCAGPWTTIPTATSSSFTLNSITAGQNNTGYRVVVSGTCPSAATSNCALLTVSTAVVITTQPTDATVCENANTSFTVAGSGTGIIYQWQVSTDGGSNWSNITNGGVYSNATTATLNITGATFSMNTFRYRCLLSSATCTTPAPSNGAILTVNRLTTITTQPQAAGICVNGNASFTVVATGTSLTYQWQVSASGCAGTFTNIANAGVYSGATTSTLTITAAPASMNGFAYKCVVTGACPPAVTTNCVVLSVGSTVTVTTQPTDQSVCAGSAASFTAAGSGTGALYQWQVSNDGGITWFNIPGATAATYAIPVTIQGMNNNRYRALVSNAACTTPAASNAALLTVNVSPIIAFTAPATICLTDPAITLSATPTGGTFAGPGVTGSTFTPSVAGLGLKAVTYSATSNGCGSVETRSILVNECSERHRRLNEYAAVFVYPIPNQGDFSIRINTDLYTKLNIKIFNSMGQLVKAEQVSGIRYGSVIPVHLFNLPGGTYQVYLSNDEKGDVSRGVPMIIGRP